MPPLAVGTSDGVRWYSGNGAGWLVLSHTQPISYCASYNLCDPQYLFDGTAFDLLGHSLDFGGPEYQQPPWQVTFDLGTAYTFTHWRVGGSAPGYNFQDAQMNAEDLDGPNPSSLTQVAGSAVKYCTDAAFSADGFVSRAFERPVRAQRWQILITSALQYSEEADFQLYLKEIQFGVAMPPSAPPLPPPSPTPLRPAARAPSPPSSIPPPPLPSAWRLVASVSALRDAISDAQVEHIVVARSGSPYMLDAQLEIARDVSIAAEGAESALGALPPVWPVVLNASATVLRASRRRVLRIGHGATVSLTGLDLTGGYTFGCDTASHPSRRCFFAETQSGGAVLNYGTTTMSRCRLYGNAALWVDGGGGAVANFGSLVMDSCEVHDNSAAPQGGGVYNDGDLQIRSTRLTRNRAQQGGGLFNSGTSRVIHSWLDANFGLHGGGAYNSGLELELEGTSLASNTAALQAAGLMVDAGVTFLRNGTLIARNLCQADGCKSHSFDSSGGVTSYLLPAPPGRWVSGLDCRVYRGSSDCQRYRSVSTAYHAGCTDQFCRYTQSQCLVHSTACGLVPNVSASVPPLGACQTAVFVQPCDWQTLPGLVGRTLQTLPQVPLAVDYPFACAPGLVGGVAAADQASSTCAGACPAGYVCPSRPTHIPLICPLGSFCPVGSARSLACPSGAFGSATGLRSADECSPCPGGHWCNSGQAFPCAVSFYTAGAAPSFARKDLAACLPCPMHSTTEREASTTESACICSEAYFLFPGHGNTSSAECRSCPTGTSCSKAGTTLQSLPVVGGFWKPSYLSVVAKACPYPAACSNGSMPNAYYDAEAGATCTGGRGVSGVYCLLCSAPNHYFDTGRARCRPCTDEFTRIVLFLGAVVVILSGLVLSVRFATRRNLLGFGSRWHRVVAAGQQVSLQTKIKICVSYYQIITQVSA